MVKTTCFGVLSVFSSAEQTTKHHLMILLDFSQQRQVHNSLYLASEVGHYPKGMSFCETKFLLAL